MSEKGFAEDIMHRAMRKGSDEADVYI